MQSNMKNSIEKAAKYWWLSLLMGAICVGLGIWALATPVTVLLAITIVFIAGLMANGLMGIAFSIANRKNLKSWGWSLVSGIIDIVIASLLLATPITTIIVLAMFFGIWIMLQSLWGFGISYSMQQAGVKGWGIALVLSILGLILSFILIINPVFTSELIAYSVAFSFIMYGILRIYYAFKLKSIKADIEY